MEVLAGILLCAAWAVIPLVCYALAMWWADRYEREPLWLISVAFLWGAVPAVLFSLVTGVAVEVLEVFKGRELPELLVLCVIVPLVEEFFKSLALLGIFLFHRRQFGGVLDGVVYGALVGFGFSMTEDFFYYVGEFLEGGSVLALMFFRGIIFALNHSFYTGLVGLGFGLAATRCAGRWRWIWPPLAFAAAVVLHGTHNFGAYISSEYGQSAPVIAQFMGLSSSVMLAVGGLLMLVGVVVGSWYHQKAAIRQELQKEVGTLLTGEELEFLTEKWVQPLFSRKRDTVRRIRLVELAFLRRKWRTSPPNSDASEGGEDGVLFEQLRVEYRSRYPDRR